MRILVFFDLPVKTTQDKKVAARFRKFLTSDGYHMLQYSMYARTCNGFDSVEKHKKRLYASLPANGSVRALTITEKQYQSIEILVGALNKPCDNIFETEQLSLF